MFIYPAVGRLIFASYPVLARRTGSHLFDSPRPCPQSRLGSRPPQRRPITSSRVGHRTQSASPLGSSAGVIEMDQLVVMASISFGASSGDLIKSLLRLGGIRLCRSATGAPRPSVVCRSRKPRSRPCGIGFPFAPANTAQSEKLIVTLSTKSLLSPFGECCGAGLHVAGLGAEQSPDEAAEFTGDGDFGFVALEPPAQ